MRIPVVSTAELAREAEISEERIEPKETREDAKMA
jgi:hypothetical protein